MSNLARQQTPCRCIWHVYSLSLAFVCQHRAASALLYVGCMYAYKILRLARASTTEHTEKTKLSIPFMACRTASSHKPHNRPNISKHSSSLPKFQCSLISKCCHKVSMRVLTQANGSFVCYLHEMFQLAGHCAEGIQYAIFT